MRATIAALFLLLLTSCASQTPWAYQSSAPSGAPMLVDATVAVGPFVDRRPAENSNMVGMGMIPLFPYGWMDLEQPEGAQGHITSGLWLWRPTEDIAKATAEELTASGMFREAFYTHRPSEGDYQLRGTLEQTKYHGKQFTYLISFFGVYLWLVGAPAGYAENTLAVDLELVDPTGRSVWRKRYLRNDDGKLSWIYVMRNDFTYPEMLKSVLDEAVVDIRRHLAPVTGTPSM